MHDEHVARRTGLVTTVDQDIGREFASRVAECSRLAFRVAFAVLRHPHDAEEVAQEAFVRAYRHYTRLRDRERFRAWLVRVTWRLAIDRQRADRRRAAREFHAERRAEATPSEAQSHLRSIELWAAIDALPEKLRLVTVLSAIEGHNIREVAALLGVPEGTVKSRLSLARQRLKERLT